MVYVILIGVLAVLMLLLYMLYKAHHDIIDYREVKSDKIDHTFHLFFISDIHRREIKPALLEKIQQEIDIVVIGGDLRESGVSIERTRDNIHRLKQWGAPVFFVWGNNDYDDNPSELHKLLMDEKVSILANSNTDINVGNNAISLIGLDCCHHRVALFDEAIQHAKGTYKILLTHAPSAFYELSKADQQKVDMVLAGHTHGGQIRLFGLGFFTRGGMEKRGTTDILVSEGYGYTRLPLRLGTNAECHLITFQNKM